MKKYFLIPTILSLVLSACSENGASSEGSDKKNSKKENSQDKSKEGEGEPAYSLKPLKECIAKGTFKSPPANCLEEFNKLLAQNEPESVDSIYVKMLKKMRQMAMTVGFDENKHYDKETWELKKGVADPYLKSGFELDQEEGMYFVAVDHKFFKEAFAERVSSEMKNLLNFRAINPEKISYDAGLILEPMDFAKRLMNEEALLTQKNDLIRKELKSQFCSELATFFTGMDNTPVYEWTEEGLYPYLPENRKALEFLKNNGGKVAKAAALIYYQSLEKSGWKVDPETFYEIYTYEDAIKSFEKVYGRD